MKKQLLSMLLIGTFAIIASSWTIDNSPLPKQIVFMVDFDEDVDVSTLPAETNPCNGEMVDFTGTIHYNGTFVLYDDGSGHLQYHGNFQNVKGIGQTTGDSYQWVGAINQSINSNAVGVMSVSSLQQCKHKGGSDYIFKLNEHFTYNANGELTAERSIESEECVE
jgi:hypothetical protein